MKIPTAGSSSARPDTPLVEALESSQRLGMLGAAPIAEVIRHSELFVEALRGVSGSVVDLGSGGGVPGLVIAWRRADLQVILVDRRQTRTDHLRRLVHRLGLTGRVVVMTSEATAVPRRLDRPVSAVVARSFGPPAVVLAAALPVLAEDGLLVVSEPPTAPDRWTPELLTGTNLERQPSDPRLAVLRRVPRESSSPSD